MTNEERQVRIGELLRLRILVADLLKTIDQRLEALGHVESVSPSTGVKRALDEAASMIATQGADRWAGWVTYLWKPWTAKRRIGTSESCS